MPKFFRKGKNLVDARTRRQMAAHPEADTDGQASDEEVAVQHEKPPQAEVSAPSNGQRRVEAPPAFGGIYPDDYPDPRQLSA